VLALVSTAIHNSVAESLAGDHGSSDPQAALKIFSAYAQDHIVDIATSDIYLQALVSTHHLTHLVPRLPEGSASSVASGVWAKIHELPVDQRYQVQATVSKAMAELMASVETRVE
jgi:hypothetical protein